MYRIGVRYLFLRRPFLNYPMSLDHSCSVFYDITLNLNIGTFCTLRFNPNVFYASGYDMMVIGFNFQKKIVSKKYFFYG